MAVAHETTSPAAAAIAAPAARSRAYAWYVLFLLTALNGLSLVDRKLPFIMVERIRRDFPLSDTQVGLLGGLAFTILYSILGFPIARLADRGSRKLIIGAAVTIWSAMTALGGLAQSFVHLAGARFGLALGEAGCVPPSQSLISDYFPPRRRALALSVFQAGAGVGVMIGMAAGGLLVERLDWRASLMVVGAVGAALAALTFLTVREPPRGASDGQPVMARARLGESLQVIASRRAFKYLALTGALFSCATSAVMTFTPSYLVRLMGFRVSEAGAFVGVTTGLTASLGVLAGGWIGTALGKGDPRRVLWVAAAGLLVGAPCLFLAFQTDSRLAILVLLSAALFLGSLYMGPVYALGQNLVPPHMRALAAAVLVFVIHGIGTSAGPLIVGMLSDHFASSQGVSSLRSALLTVTVGYALAAVALLLASRTLRADLASAELDRGD